MTTIRNFSNRDQQSLVLFIWAVVLALAISQVAFAEEGGGYLDKTADKIEKGQKEKKPFLDNVVDSLKVEPSPSPTPVKESAHEVMESPSKTKTFSLGYAASPLSLWVPFKHGPYFGVRLSEASMMELGYFRGAVKVPFFSDIGGFEDRQIYLIYRGFSDSFNWHVGLNHVTYSAKIGDELLSRVTAGSVPSVELLEIQNLAVTAGLGHRWQIGDWLSLGVDWIALNIPVVNLKSETGFLDQATNQSDKDNVDKFVSVLKRFPTLTLLKLQLGVTF